MKRALAGLTAMFGLLALGSAAHAANFYFDLSGEGYWNGADIGTQNITGEIYGLPSANGAGVAAADITVNDPTVSFFFGVPVDFGGGGAFNVTNGALTAASYTQQISGLLYSGSLNLNNGTGSYDAALAELGAYGIDDGTVTYASAAPEPSVWALMVAGIGMLGCTMRRAKRSRAGRSPDMLAA